MNITDPKMGWLLIKYTIVMCLNFTISYHCNIIYIDLRTIIASIL